MTETDKTDAAADKAPATATGKGAATADAMPDRLSMDPASAHFDEELLMKGIGIRFNGAEKTNVEEYCVSEGWVRMAVGKSRDRFGNPMTVKAKGKVEPYIKGND